jgi:hypothetical protein
MSLPALFSWSFVDDIPNMKLWCIKEWGTGQEETIWPVWPVCVPEKSARNRTEDQSQLLENEG